SAVLFANLLEALSSREGKVVVLVDEYDKVLSDNVFSPEVEKLRQVLGNFYQVIKTKGALLRFVFITGVTKYARLSVFSKMNNLNDLSLAPAYATMLGYTQKELEENFAGYIEQGVRDTGMGREAYLAKVREMYDGYRFAPGCETVYNPVSVGLFFTNGRGQDFEDYWIETGNSKLVMDMAQSVDLDVTEDLKRGMAKRSLATFDVAELGRMKGDADKVQAFLLQTGYLTIGRADEAKGLYYLRMPNREVEEAYDGSLLERLREKPVEHDLGDMCDALKAGETKRYMEVLASFFAGIPYMDGRRKEADYALVVAALARLMRRQVVAAVEERTSEGRIDLAVETDRHVYVMEYKVDKSAETALRQIKEKRYADKFRLEKGKTIHLLGIAFSSTGHTVQDWKEEVLS
ncbi:MAG: AAA family ATPase, partial [Sphaerochaetaceae bacterium]|nr:AAA family ATPase [Sphaerochaetaceae bacterium]